MWGISCLLVCAAAVVLLALVAGVILVPHWAVGPQDDVPPQVTLELPASDSDIRVPDEVPLIARVLANTPLVRLELWVDGILLKTLEASGAEKTPLSPAQFMWRPKSAGAHILVARAVDERGATGTSRPLIVVATLAGDTLELEIETSSGDTLQSIADNFSLPRDVIQAANPGINDPLPAGGLLVIPMPRERLPEGYSGDDLDLGSAEPAEAPETPPIPAEGDEGPAEEVQLISRWILPRGLQWNLGNPTPPKAPSRLGLAPSGDCGVRVQFDDLSKSEAGFRVYRFGADGADFRPVAELGPNKTFSDLVFQDRVPFPGPYLYYVAAVDARTEAPGPIRSIDLTPEECPQEGVAGGGGSLTLQLEVVSLTTTPPSGLDSTYCYLSLAFLGGSHIRLPRPEDTFFSPTPDGWNIADYAAGDGRFTFVQPVDESIPLGMECWGWAGDSLLNLGSFSTIITSGQWRETLPLTIPGKGSGPDGGGFAVVFRLTWYFPDLTYYKLGSNCEQPCYTYLQPPYGLQPAESPDECSEHTGLLGGNLGDGAVAAPWACLALPAENLMIWEWDETEQVPRGDLEGFRLYTYTLRDALVNYDAEWIDPIGSAAQIMPIHKPSCGRTYYYRAIAYMYWEDAQGSTTEVRSSYSDPIQIVGPECPTYSASIRVSLDELHVSDSSDVDGLESLCFFCDEDVTQEAYGLVRVAVDRPSTGEEEKGRIILWDTMCGSEVGLVPCGDHTHHVTNGDYSLEEASSVSCEFHGAGGTTCDSEGGGRNDVAFTVYPLDAIWVYVTLWDEDDSTGDDIFCSGMTTTGAILLGPPYTGWQEGDVSQHVIDDDTSDASCRISVNLEVLALYRTHNP
jgi:hypothetical protein